MRRKQHLIAESSGKKVMAYFEEKYNTTPENHRLLTWNPVGDLATEPKQEFFTIDEVAIKLNVTTRTIKSLIKYGHLRATKISQRITRIYYADLELFLSKQRRLRK